MKTPLRSGSLLSRLPSEITRAWQTDLARGGPSPARGDDRERRSAAIAAKIGREATRRKRVQRLRRACVGVAALAAATALGVGVHSFLTHGRSVAGGLRGGSVNRGNRVTAGEETSVAQATVPRTLRLGETFPIREGETVRTDSGSAAVDLGDTAHLELGGDTEIRILEDGAPKRQIQLGRGHVLVSVQKSAGREFSVVTPDARVIVHGTVFSVDVVPSIVANVASAANRASAANVAFTRVAVREGIVTVVSADGAHALASGETWASSAGAAGADVPSPSDPDPAGAVVAPPPGVGPEPTSPLRGSTGPLATRRVLVRGPSETRSTSRSPQADPSTPSASGGEVAAQSLSLQNRAFERGLKARDRGDASTALSIFRGLLRDYPNSPIAESARLEIEALERSGRH